MIKINYHARVGYTRVINRVCTTCKGVWASMEHSNCPKCNKALVHTAVKTPNGVRPYCFTEVTLYPVMPEKIKTTYMSKLQKSKSLGFIVKLKLWGHYDEATKTALPDNRTAYLTPKREVLVETNNPPLYSVFHTREGVPMLQILHEFGYGDKITYLGYKDNYNVEETTRQTLIPPAPVAAPIPVSQPTNTDLEGQLNALQAQLKALMATITPQVSQPQKAEVAATISDLDNVVTFEGDCDENYYGEDITLFEID